jgi:hypothetical protein
VHLVLHEREEPQRLLLADRVELAPLSRSPPACPARPGVLAVVAELTAVDSRIARHVERMSKEHPGLDFTRTDAVRSLLTRALDQIEGPSAPTKRGGR